MKEIISRSIFGDTELVYLKDGACVSMAMVPALHGELDFEAGHAEPLVQLHIKGDAADSNHSAGLTMRDSASTRALEYVSQTVNTDGSVKTVETVMQLPGRCRVYHTLSWHEGDAAFEIQTSVENISQKKLPLELLTSANLGYLTPYHHAPSETELTIHRVRSFWSEEGRIQTNRVEELNLEPSWALFSTRVEKIGQIGSMPVRGYFPFGAVTDDKHSVTWAMQLGCSASWQIEFIRRDEFLCVSGGLADYNYGQFRKLIKPGERFNAPIAYLTVCTGGVDTASQRILTIQQRRYDERRAEFDKDFKESLPVVFNEYCTTWGVPSEENIERILEVVKNRGIRYFVIDAGWYAPENGSWSTASGDWIVSDRLFPNGMKYVTDKIRRYGMLPGIWFEGETCAPMSKNYNKPEMLLSREGDIVTDGGKRFLDMRKPAVRAFLDERITGFLRDNGFGYMKSDYNDSIGIGCDGSDSLGLGLYENIEASKNFYQSIKDAVPGIMLECCASGGHRLEPSLLGVFDMASFSDAHECTEIPIIAANVSKMMIPSEEQIWAVLRGSDTIKRTVWSIISTFFGVMCLSGDVYNLSGEQWKYVDGGISFYNDVAEIIRHGFSQFYRSGLDSYRHSDGWQSVLRRGQSGELLAVIHMFGGELPDVIETPLGEGYKIGGFYGEHPENAEVEAGILKYIPTENYEAAAVRLIRG